MTLSIDAMWRIGLSSEKNSIVVVLPEAVKSNDFDDQSQSELNVDKGNE